MLIRQLTTSQNTSSFAILSERCSHFLQEANGETLLKNLSKDYNNIHKVKARKRNISNEFTVAFNQAFENFTDDLCQRAIFTCGITSFEPDATGVLEPFYIFPVDGYQYLYSSEVKSSSDNHKQLFDVMFEQFGFEKGKDIMLEVLKFAYQQDNLQEGITRGAEIILFNTPVYYAVRASLYEYDNLLTLIQSQS